MDSHADNERLDRRRRDRAERALARVHAIRTFNAAETGDLAFMGKSLVQLTLPHTDPGDVEFYERRNGDLRLIVQPGFTDVDGKTELVGIPYGSYPRLVLAWVTTEAVRTGNRDLCLGGSLTAFMDELGLASGGETSRILRDQMTRLFTARIAFVEVGEGHLRQRGLQLIDDANLWWEADGRAPVTSKTTIRLSEDFHRLITERPVPLDMRALQVLKESPLGLDLYAWVTHRVSYMERETVISWRDLEAQFGGGYAETKEFARKVKRELKRIRLVWPELEYRTPRGRLVLKPCAPHVRRKLNP